MANLVKLLNFGRKLGYENVAQLQALKQTAKKAIETGNIPTAIKGHFELTTKQLKEFQDLGYKMQEQGLKKLGGLSVEIPWLKDQVSLQKKIMELGGKYAPKAYADDTKHVVEFGAKRFGTGSGVVEMKVSNSKNSVLGKIKMLLNRAGARVKGTIHSEIGSADADVTVLRNAQFKNPTEMAKNLKIQTGDKSVVFSLPKTRGGNVIAAMEGDINSEYANRLTNYVSKGRFYDVSEALAEFDKLRAKL